MKCITTSIAFFFSAFATLIHAADSNSYLGIFDASVGETGHISVIVRQINIDESGNYLITKPSQLPHMVLVGLNNPVVINATSQDISSEVQRSTKNGKLKLICDTCSKNVPSNIVKNYGISDIYELQSDIYDLKKDIFNFKKMLSNRVVEIEKEEKRKDQEAKAAVALEIKNAEERKRKFLARHDTKCKSFGFKPNTESYAQCRLKLELSENQAAREDALNADEERRHQENLKEQSARQKRELDAQSRYANAQLEEQRLSRQAAAAQALMKMAQPPVAPPPTSQTIITPNGRMVNCHTTGTVTNCF
jgi:flagellar biosynthesis GTPase FlhF